MSHTFTCKGPKRYRYYTCTAAMKRGRKSCATPSLPTEQIERVVIDQIRDIANNKHLREEVLRHANTQLESELAEWRLEKAAVLQELARLRAATQTPDLQEKIAHYETRSGELERRIEQREVERLNARSVKEAFANFDSLWASLPPREQVELTNLLVARVEFDPVESAVSVSFHPDRLGSLVNTQTRGAT